MSAVKVLLAGDCLGGFDTLFKKVAAVNKKNGPFDLLLCVGQFFEGAGTFEWTLETFPTLLGIAMHLTRAERPGSSHRLLLCKAHQHVTSAVVCRR